MDNLQILEALASAGSVEAIAELAAITMNARRRERISAVIQKLGELKDEVEQLKDEEQEYFDNMPESLQGGDKGQAAETALEALQCAEDNIEGATTYLEGVE